MPTALAKQLRMPSGFFGRLVSKMMEIRNKGSYEKIIKDLDIRKGEKIFEIGYGPGMGIKLIAENRPDCTISGIDNSELMYIKAIRKNKKFIEKGIVNLQYGDLLTVEPNLEKYNKIFCINVIYFWIDLNKAFKKVYSMLETGGEFLIYMDHEKEIGKFKFTRDFCKYSIEKVEIELKNAAFGNIEYYLDKGYYVKAKK